LCWNGGVELHVIGQPEKEIYYPCVALHLGDGPAQKEVCGIMKSNCSYGCTYCEHKTLSNELSNPILTHIRNLESIKRLCKKSDHIMLAQKRALSPEHKNVKETLQQKTVYSYYNSFLMLPWG